MDERKVAGVEYMEFTGRDGETVSGMTVHTTEKIDAKRGQGERTDHFFLSKKKLSTLDFTPAPGQRIVVFYNRYGKVASLKLVSDDSIVID